jgi:ABC-type dipeptide/oligopeptide/nickel transport system ATPase component
MSTLVGIVGQSGSGKSTSIETLNPKETVIINVSNKPLPFRGWKSNYVAKKLSEGGNYAVTDSAATIITALEYISKSRPEIKHIVIDDSQYLMSFEFMAKAKEKGYDKFTNIAKNTFDVLNVARNLRDDLIVFSLYHEEEVSDNFAKRRKIKTIGKLLDDKITLEGLFTIVLFTEVVTGEDNNTNYYFSTQTDGSSTAKSPKGMFEEKLIPNDLKVVAESINSYYQ